MPRTPILVSSAAGESGAAFDRRISTLQRDADCKTSKRYERHLERDQRIIIIAIAMTTAIKPTITRR
jgi:hypothetical protein